MNVNTDTKPFGQHAVMLTMDTRMKQSSQPAFFCTGNLAYALIPTENAANIGIITHTATTVVFEAQPWRTILGKCPAVNASESSDKNRTLPHCTAEDEVKARVLAKILTMTRTARDYALEYPVSPGALSSLVTLSWPMFAALFSAE